MFDELSSSIAVMYKAHGFGWPAFTFHIGVARNERKRTESGAV